MPTTPIEFVAPPGQILSLELYPFGSDAIANGAGGDSGVERANADGLYSADVTQALIGLFDAVIRRDSGSALLANYIVNIRADDTTIYKCADDVYGAVALPDAAAAGAGGLATVDVNNRIAGIQGAKNTLDDLNDLSAAQVNAEVDTALSDYGALQPTVAGRKLDVTATGAGGIDWGNVENQATAVDLSDTAINLCDTVTVNSDMRGTDAALLAANVPTNFADLSITAVQGRVDVALIEGADATNQIRDAVIDDATRLDGSAINGLAANDPGSQIAAQSDITALNNLSAAQVNAEVDAALSDYGALQPTVAGRKLDVTATGAGGIDWGNVENQATAVDLSDTAINLCDTVTVNSDMRGTDAALLAANVPTNFADLSITVVTGRVDTGFIEGVDATNQIRDAVIDDATRLDGSAINGLAANDPGSQIAAQSDITALNNLSAAQVNAEVDAALNTAIPGVPTADSINQRVKAIDELTEAAGAGDLAAVLADTDSLDTTKLTTARANNLDNLDATISSRATLANQALQGTLVNQTAMLANQATQLADLAQLKSDNPNAPTKGVAFNNFKAMMYDANDHFTPKAGLGGGVTAMIQKDAGAFVAITGTVNEIGLGLYSIDTLTIAEMTADLITIQFTAVGADVQTISFATQPT